MYQPIIINPWHFIAFGATLAVVSLTSLFIINKYDDPKPPEKSKRGIKERVFWIGFVLILLIAFVVNCGYFFMSQSPHETYEEKYRGVPQMIKEAEKTAGSLNTPRLRRISPQYFNGLRTAIDRIDDSYADGAVIEIKNTEEWKVYVAQVDDYNVFLDGQIAELKKFEKLRESRVENRSCPNDYMFPIEAFRIKNRVFGTVQLILRDNQLHQFGGYALEMKSEIPKMMYKEAVNISRHCNMIADFYDFINEEHLDKIKQSRENRAVSRSLEEQHFFSGFIVAMFTTVGVVYCVMLIYILITLIKNREIDYLRQPLTPYLTKPEVLGHCLSIGQNTSWGIPCFILLGFVVLRINNMIAPNCSVLHNRERMVSFDGKNTITSFELFNLCAANGTGVVTLYGDDLLITTNQLIKDIANAIEINPMDTPAFNNLIVQHQYNTMLLDQLDRFVEEDYDCGMTKEEVKEFQTMVKSIVERDQQFVNATEKLKSFKLQSFIHEAFFKQVESEVGNAVADINKYIKRFDFNCQPISVLTKKIESVHCQKHSYFDEALIHWVVMAYLFMIISFLILRFYHLNTQRAEQWEIDMANAPRYFGSDCGNPRYRKVPRDNGPQ